MHGKSEATHKLSEEIVLCTDAVAKQAHKQLFCLSDASYVSLNGELISSIISAAQEPVVKLHIAADWETVLKVALWTSGRPSTHDALALLKKMGVSDNELSPFSKADINDLYPWLYYGKKFDILRKICNAAKAKAESRIVKKKVLVYCHMVSPDPQKIVASSL